MFLGNPVFVKSAKIFSKKQTEKKISKIPGGKKFQVAFGNDFFLRPKNFLMFPFLSDISGSMCVTTEVGGKLDLRGARGTPAEIAAMTEGSSQWLPGQRNRNVSYISRLQARRKNWKFFPSQKKKKKKTQKFLPNFLAFFPV